MTDTLDFDDEFPSELGEASMEEKEYATTRLDQARWYIYWIPEADLPVIEKELHEDGFTVRRAQRSACQVLKAADKTVWIAEPLIFHRTCKRQGSWYRRSRRAGQTLLVSARPLGGTAAKYPDVEIAETDFTPESLPGDEEIAELVASEEYQNNKPPEWEMTGFKDAIVQKLLFTILGIWKRGDSLKKYWPSQCAVHANFLKQSYTVELDGEAVPYSVANSAGICSSCVETFNLISPETRKLVAPCPGSINFGGSKKDVYVDVRPVRPVDPEDA